jgi:hypothetical protein
VLRTQSRTSRLRATIVTISVAATVFAALVPATAIATAATRSKTARLRPNTNQLIAQAVNRGEITESTGALYLTYAFTAPEQLPATYASTTPWDGTLPLLELKRTLKRLPADSAARAADARLAQIFACPGASGPVSKVKKSDHFYLQYGTIHGGLTANQYVNTLETSWDTEVTRFGWAKPPKDPVSYPAGGRYPVRVDNLPSGLYGYVTSTRRAGNNPATPWPDKDAYASCMVLSDDYRGFPSNPKDSLTATVAHEFNHSLQFGYGALSGPDHAADVYVEGGASWMEDEVFDGSNDNYFYLWPSFTTPMPLFDPRFPYPYWVVFRALTEHEGPSGQAGAGEGVMQSFWEQVSRGTATNSAALNRALKEQGTTLGKAYHDAAIALRFNQGCANTETRFCLEEGPSYVALAGTNGNTRSIGPGNDLVDEKIANDYSLDWVGLPTGTSFSLTVDVHGGGGILRTSVACRAGDQVTQISSVVIAQGSTDAEHPVVDTSGCDQAVLVITNENQTSSTPKTKSNATYDVTSSL